MISFAVAGPTPGNVSSSALDAVFRSIFFDEGTRVVGLSVVFAGVVVLADRESGVSASVVDKNNAPQ